VSTDLQLKEQREPESPSEHPAYTRNELDKRAPTSIGNNTHVRVATEIGLSTTDAERLRPRAASVYMLAQTAATVRQRLHTHDIDGTTSDDDKKLHYRRGTACLWILFIYLF